MGQIERPPDRLWYSEAFRVTSKSIHLHSAVETGHRQTNHIPDQD